MSATTKRLTSFIVARSSVRRTHQLSTAASARSTAPAGRSWLSLISHSSRGIVAPSSRRLDDTGVEAAGCAEGSSSANPRKVSASRRSRSAAELPSSATVVEVRRRVLAELGEDLLGGDLILHAHRQPVLKEQVDAGSEAGGLAEPLAATSPRRSPASTSHPRCRHRRRGPRRAGRRMFLIRSAASSGVPRSLSVSKMSWSSSFWSRLIATIYQLLL